MKRFALILLVISALSLILAIPVGLIAGAIAEEFCTGAIVTSICAANALLTGIAACSVATYVEFRDN